MLEELKRAHDRLLACIDELAALTRDETPDRQRLASVRWKLSKVSGERRKLVEEACDRLAARGGMIEQSRVSTLREANAAMVTVSSRHVRRWSMEQVLADWNGYREASAAIREAMRGRIAQEQRALYPLLERAAA